MCIGILGFAISMSTLNAAARYAALFLQASSYAGYIVFYSWISSSFPRPPAKRAVAIAIINACAQLGNIAGSYVWGLEENGYRKSYGIVLAMFVVAIVGCWVTRFMLANLNKQFEANEDVDIVIDAVESTPGVLGHSTEARRTHKGFRYLL